MTKTKAIIALLIGIFSALYLFIVCVTAARFLMESNGAGSAAGLFGYLFMKVLIFGGLSAFCFVYAKGKFAEAADMNSNAPTSVAEAMRRESKG